MSFLRWVVAAMAIWAAPAAADTTEARCDIYNAGSDSADRTIACTVSQRQGHINAANREAEASQEGDTWIVTINGEEVYKVPLAAIEGG